MAHNQGLTGNDVRVPRHHRQPVRLKATLHAYGGSRRVEIVDYSPHGLGLERVSGIQPQERVTVELPAGLRLPMMVLWVEDGRAGLRFLGPIAPGHTVVRSLEEAARRFKRSHPSPKSA
jgi:hypothetical protein